MDAWMEMSAETVMITSLSRQKIVSVTGYSFGTARFVCDDFLLA